MKVKPLGEFDIYINDGNYGNIYPEKELFTNEGIPFISASDFNGRTFNYEGIKFISEELHFNILKKGHLKVNDIVIVVRGNGIGKVGFFKDEIGECNMNAQLAFIRTNPNQLNPLYLYYLMSSQNYLELIQRFGTGSAQPQLPINRLKMVPIIEKDIQTQFQIAKVLSDLDAKIELNNKINAELEAMAKLIYDYWFVQFDFPNEVGKPYKSSGGKMVWNEELKREVPEGWEVKELGEISEIKAGGDKPMNISETQSYIHQIPIYSNGIMNEGLYGFTNEAKILKPSITVSARGTIGYCVLRLQPFVPIIRLISISPKNTFELVYLFQNINRLQFENSGSVQQQLTVPQISKLKVLFSSDQLIEQFNNLTYSSIIKIENNKQQNQKLAELRDWLLPMLMNGQVKVDKLSDNDETLNMAAEEREKYR